MEEKLRNPKYLLLIWNNFYLVFCQITSVSQYSDVDMLVITMASPLAVTQDGALYVVSIEFSGPLTNDLDGLYLSSYKRNGQDV